jgi:hypothetical protein
MLWERFGQNNVKCGKYSHSKIANFKAVATRGGGGCNPPNNLWNRFNIFRFMYKSNETKAILWCMIQKCKNSDLTSQIRMLEKYANANKLKWSISDILAKFSRSARPCYTPLGISFYPNHCFPDPKEPPAVLNFVYINSVYIINIYNQISNGIKIVANIDVSFQRINCDV